ncbi:Nucleoside-diphosphate-sugar epimerase (WcaG) (PDB:2X4G) [Commensalibacter communis]|uniref:Nucleoside-diphosphate-sugar epimerase (WcaG) n=1 Tax=Commensalibacter communis TaxID=2972786 RepID=A0A9W4TLV2_9PROT|nr:hopanoid-associated sugar epimerase [Commensalibacter communis]CAI3938305.1 Nucleoside-diphosphate-sugar epimerase (WcaG) (PDB:2X4G) [Commensalibacter communis]CAI3938508.1 Nucleoside-diphosphate-sugar epimerase (WcaG) (PDB:2X4G) [Commensalibacter communis]CAI3939912.1 Nucleoside-diphosphate-sugar epimerase (WcaG) (PDB:2X4G) [Commensalibacter communis]CAI3941674.1 Nucleoside-diphosphate-sugar epimerase (WcaG) (PDB:2X4G) [Commensalibacter communis]CAI3941832.1 Nucleoside-diphosphate-sugar ep
MVTSTFVTGVTGFVGSAVARKLVERGHHLRVLTRPNSNKANLQGLDAAVVEGDLLNPEAFEESLRGCKYLFHVAADYRLWVPDPAQMMKINVEGTRRLMLAAQRVGVEKIVYCSSVAALGLVGDGSIADETTPVHKIIGIYKQSKYEAEQAVLKLIQENQLPAVIVNPSTPIGPRDIKPTPTGQMILDCTRGKMPAYVDTGLNIVHVDDVAEGHLLALEKGVIGEKYILGGENMSLRDFFAMTSKIANVRPPLMRLNQKLIWPVAIASEWMANRFGIQPRVTREMLLMSYKKMFFSSAKAERELGYRYRPAHEAIKDAVDWFRQQGYVR